ncbi:hypothetical protein [Butyrivibrio sp. XPD2002]|uniref:hypothetical protein n=1 Tax=Butyrivibrio sp. XPD2002 TaxID=1280665 RepID=UPI000417830B|nr:hypothetical protein [Butyrivibrio sp. XPD2002]
MESILIFFITIIVLAYRYLKKNKGTVLKKSKKLGIRIISIILIAILICAVLVEEITQKLLDEIGKQNLHA